MLDIAAQKYYEYHSNEIIIVNLTNQEVRVGYSPAEMILNHGWNSERVVEVTSIRNDCGHISVTFNDNVEI